jgi:hypothetical protein
MPANFGIETQADDSAKSHGGPATIGLARRDHGFGLAPPHEFEPRSPHSKCSVLPLDEGGAVKGRRAES